MQEILASDAWHLLSSNNNAMIVDVRSKEEWLATGIASGSTICVSLLNGPDMELNLNFAKQLQENAKTEQSLLFICRSGGRSAQAAEIAKTLGYKDCYNVIDGIEGSAHGVGWKELGLPLVDWRGDDVSN